MSYLDRRIVTALPKTEHDLCLDEFERFNDDTGRRTPKQYLFRSILRDWLNRDPEYRRLVLEAYSADEWEREKHE